MSREGGDLQGGAICTKAGVPDYYGEQVATEDEVRKRWRGRAADGIHDEEQQRVEIRGSNDALLLILSGTLDRGRYFHAANRATNSGGKSNNWRKSSRIN